MQYSPASRSADASPVLQTALAALEAGISVVPIRPDGTKRPALASWKRWQTIRPTVAEVRAWFRDPRRGLALVTGRISGSLIAIDFDDEATFLAWRQSIQGDRTLNGLYEEIAHGYEERTPSGGRHLLFRCPGGTDSRSQPLALRQTPRRQVLIETREEGGIIIVDPSRGGVHPSGRPYLRLCGSVSSICQIGPTDRELLYTSLRAFDEPPPRATCSSLPPCSSPAPFRSLASRDLGSRPGDLFNRDPQVTWESILLPKGWELVRIAQGEGYWRHPGKVGAKHSATTNYGGHDFLYVFTPSTVFQPQRAYSKFEAYALLYHGGDFRAAAKALKQRYRSGQPKV
ncbi:MAG: bifunctional DNA primase/polymerase [Thermogemmatispora sp.]|uniref:bifunctional DNA primase/polymerase n=1 Tax=Thermogemmatispora sp. TaxID=1968838 RepID=UPI002619ECAB|nr:bifunctional DNA primase/polymerase [Thermogemmatispora sp.]MBX5458387.1 bifunctional DNA primase/polymerase [Thermogemmatispora sp.]